jgi:predicted ATPase
MLRSFEVKNFRSLDDLQVAKLGRVNLIVGKNNSGKSSVLEALQIFAGNANLSLLESIAAGHDEKFRVRENERDEQDVQLPFENFFSGRTYPKDDDTLIEIGDPLTGQMLQIHHGFFVENRENYIDENGEAGFRVKRRRIAKSDLDQLNEEEPKHALYVRKGDRVSMLRLDPATTRFRSPPADLPGTIPCSVIPTQFISIDELADEWDKIALTDNQAIVVEALRTITPEFEGLTFVRNDEAYNARRTLTRSAKVRLSNYNRPVPLNSLGDGMLRVLQLVLKVFPARGGLLLIDEFENGLHYSVQEKVWAFVFDLAVKLDIQVFATTHSWDCIESFASVAACREDVEGVLFRVGRSVRTSDRGRIIATVFEEDQLRNITQAEVEVR